MKNVILSIVFAIALAVLILTFSIGLPIYFRPFYYWQIESLNIVNSSGFTFNEITTAFDQMMHYLTLPGTKFASGVVPYTPEFAAHMADVKVLFNVNLIALIVSFTAVVSLFILKRKGLFNLCRPFGMHVAFIPAVCITGLFLVVGVAAAIAPSEAFVIFHDIFFGGENWLFNASSSPVSILPEQFFLNCGILILSSVLIISISIIVFQIVKKVKAK